MLMGNASSRRGKVWALFMDNKKTQKMAVFKNSFWAELVRKVHFFKKNRNFQKKTRFLGF